MSASTALRVARNAADGIVDVDERDRKCPPVGRMERAAHLTGEESTDARRGRAGLAGDHLAQDPDELLGHLRGGLEPVVRVGRGCSLQEAVQGVVGRVRRDVVRRRQRVLVGALVAAELGAEHGEGAADGEEIRRHGRARPGDLRGLVPHGAVHGAGLVAHAIHAAEVDELQRAPALDHVVGLEVAIQQPVLVEVTERGQNLEDVARSRE